MEGWLLEVTEMQRYLVLLAVTLVTLARLWPSPVILTDRCSDP